MTTANFVEVMNEASKTHEILEQLKEQTKLNETLQQHNETLQQQNEMLRQKVDKMLKFIRSEFQEM